MRSPFVAVKENIRFEGRQDLQTKVMTTLFGVEPTLVSPAAKFVPDYVRRSSCTVIPAFYVAGSA